MGSPCTNTVSYFRLSSKELLAARVIRLQERDVDVTMDSERPRTRKVTEYIFQGFEVPEPEAPAED